MNLGETLGVAVNSKGDVVVLNHPGSPTTGPLCGNATTQLLVFDRSGKFVKEIGQGVLGLGYAHAVRFDRYDNLWVVDKGTNAVMKFNPAGYVTMNLGRRPGGYEGEYHRPEPEKAVPVDGLFNGPTDIAWDANEHLYQRGLRQQSHREVRQERQLGENVGPIRRRRRAREHEPGALP